ASPYPSPSGSKLIPERRRFAYGPSAQDALEPRRGVERAAGLDLEGARLVRLVGRGADLALEPVRQRAPPRERIGHRQAGHRLRVGQEARLQRTQEHFRNIRQKTWECIKAAII